MNSNKVLLVIGLPALVVLAYSFHFYISWQRVFTFADEKIQRNLELCSDPVHVKLVGGTEQCLRIANNNIAAIERQKEFPIINMGVVLIIGIILSMASLKWYSSFVFGKEEKILLLLLAVIIISTLAMYYAPKIDFRGKQVVYISDPFGLLMILGAVTVWVYTLVYFIRNLLKNNIGNVIFSMGIVLLSYRVVLDLFGMTNVFMK